MKRLTWALSALALLTHLHAADKKPSEDKAATKLLAEARAARASWKKFPGFTAQLTVNVDGQSQTCSVKCDEEGHVKITGLKGEELHSAVKRQIHSLASHRLFRARDYATPCAFDGEEKNHPLGRKIQVLNDELHSSYRIRDRQIVEVNRQMRGVRFTITVGRNSLNKEKQFLPANYVVNTWSLKTGALVSSQTFHHRWKRIGGFDLPTSIRLVTADSKGRLSCRELTFSKLRLTGKPAGTSR